MKIIINGALKDNTMQTRLALAFYFSFRLHKLCSLTPIEWCSVDRPTNILTMQSLIIQNIGLFAIEVLVGISTLGSIYEFSTFNSIWCHSEICPYVRKHPLNYRLSSFWAIQKRKLENSSIPYPLHFRHAFEGANIRTTEIKFCAHY